MCACVAPPLRERSIGKRQHLDGLVRRCSARVSRLVHAPVLCVDLEPTQFGDALLPTGPHPAASPLVSTRHTWYNATASTQLWGSPVLYTSDPPSLTEGARAQMNRGMTLGDFDTPALAIDLDVLEHNIQRLQDTVQIRGIANRPYVTTHGILDIALAQLAAGAAGVACQTPGEAMILARAGISDILVTGSITGHHEVERVVGLAKRTQLALVLDDVRVAQGISDAATAAGSQLGVLVRLATTDRAVGVRSPRELVERTICIARLAGLSWRGIMLHPSMAEHAEQVSDTVARLEREGLPARTVSGGGTQAIGHIDWIVELTEFRAGTYALNDKVSVDRGAAVLDDCALSVVVTVTSQPAHDRRPLGTSGNTLRPASTASRSNAVAWTSVHAQPSQSWVSGCVSFPVTRAKQCALTELCTACGGMKLRSFGILRLLAGRPNHLRRLWAGAALGKRQRHVEIPGTAMSALHFEADVAPASHTCGKRRFRFS
jgi:D-serine deaminase-like pyridoxal phosphate-dependent protein